MSAATWHASAKSGNRKTGAMLVTTSPRYTCPAACKLRRTESGVSGCHADSAPMVYHWDKVSRGERGVLWNAFLSIIRALDPGEIWRHNQAGDLPGVGDAIDADALADLVDANRGRRGFTYTHKPLTPSTIAALQEANAAGFTVNVSADNPAHARAIRDATGLPVVCLVPADTVKKIVDGAAVCPATYRDINCAQCGICQYAERSFTVAFPAHGSARRKAEKETGNA